MTLALVVDILFSDPARVTIRTNNEATLCKLRLHHTPPLPKDLPQEQASLSSVPVSLFGALLFEYRPLYQSCADQTKSSAGGHSPGFEFCSDTFEVLSFDFSH